MEKREDSTSWENIRERLGRIGRGADESLGQSFREGYAEAMDPFGEGSVLVSAEYDTQELAEKALLALGVAVAAYYTVSKRRVVLKAALASIMIAGVAEANEGQSLSLNLKSGGSATVQFVSLADDTFMFKAGTQTYQRPISDFDEASQQKIRDAAGKTLNEPATLNRNEVVDWSSHPLIRPIAMPTSEPEAIENTGAVSNAFTIRLGDRGKALPPIISPDGASLWDTSLEDTGAESLWALEESPWVWRGEIITAEDARILGEGENGIPVRDAIVYGEGGQTRMIHIMFNSLGSAHTEAKIQSQGKIDESEVKQAIREDQKAATERLTELFGEPTETTYGPDFFSNTPVRNGRAPSKEVLRWDWGNTAIMLIHERNIYAGLVITTTAEADSGGALEVPEKEEIERHLQRSVHSNEVGLTWIEDIPTTNQEGKNDCLPANAERMLAHQGLIRPGTSFLFDLAAECETDVSGTNVNKFKAAMTRVLKGTDSEIATGTLSMKEVEENVKDGVPMAYSLYYTTAFQDYVHSYTASRLGIQTSDLRHPERVLEAMRNMTGEAPNPPALGNVPKQNLHSMLINGVLPETNEVIVSHPAGKDRMYLLIPFDALKRFGHDTELLMVKPK